MEESQNTMETQPKEGPYADFLQFYYGKKNHDKITTQINHKKDKIVNRMPTIERNNSEYKQVSQNRESCLYRTRQIQNKSYCITPEISKYDNISTKEDTEEEVSYSEGEPFEGYPHPNNTWDSKDSMYEEDYSIKSDEYKNS